MEKGIREKKLLFNLENNSSGRKCFTLSNDQKAFFSSIWAFVKKDCFLAVFLYYKNHQLK